MRRERKRRVVATIDSDGSERVDYPVNDMVSHDEKPSLLKTMLLQANGKGMPLHSWTIRVIPTVHFGILDERLAVSLTCQYPRSSYRLKVRVNMSRSRCSPTFSKKPGN